MSKFDTLIDNKIIQNLVVWFGLFLIISLTITADNPFTTSLFAIALLIPPIYINNLYILSFFKTKFWTFLGLFFLNAVLFTIICVNILKLVLGKVDIKSYFNFFGVLVLALIFASALKLARDSFIRRQEEKKAQLQLLKAQLNPHFLFNTLNNLYGLSVIKSDKLPNLMLKLSDLLRYSLYETKDTLVPLEKEITYLENYIALEKIRLENTKITFEAEGSISEHRIAPMLCIIFVENAFKHLGGSNEEVVINLSIQDNILSFSCKNTIDTNAPVETNLEKGKSGIGLKNAKKRLAILYPNKHTLTLKKNSEWFMANLTVEL